MLFKQRDNRFYPPSAWSLALLIVRIPFQLMEALIYSCIVYFWVGERLQTGHVWEHQPVHLLPLWLGWSVARTLRRMVTLCF